MDLRNWQEMLMLLPLENAPLIKDQEHGDAVSVFVELQQELGLTAIMIDD